MKTTSLVHVYCCLLLSLIGRASDVAGVWSAGLVVAQQATAQDAGGRTRADEILRAVLAGAKSGLGANKASGRSAEPVPAGANRDAAAAQAAHTALAVLYPALDARLAESLAEIHDSEAAVAAGKAWGEHVARVVLAERSEAVLLNATSFDAKPQPPAEPTPLPGAKAEDGAMSPGRYRFTILAGELGTKGYVDAVGSAARFDNPGGIAVDAEGNVYVSERDQGTIRKISPVGVVSTLAGAPGQSGSQDGSGAEARFNKPRGLAVDNAGNIYVADTGNRTIRKIDPAGNVTTFAGKAGVAGAIDGDRQNALFHSPAYVAVDASGTVFVTEDDFYEPSHTFSFIYAPYYPIRKIAPDGMVSRLTIVQADGMQKYAYYGAQKQICVDRGGNLYVIDTDYWDYSNVVMLAPTADKETYIADQIRPVGFDYWWVTGIGVDAPGNLYIRSLDAPLFVYMLDTGWQIPKVTGNLNDIEWVEEVVVGASGKLYIVRNFLAEDKGHVGAVLTGDFDPSSTGPVILVQPKSQTIRRGAGARFEVTVAATAPFSYQWYFNSKPIEGATNSFLDVTNVQREVLGNYSVVVTDSVSSVTSREAVLSMSESTEPTVSSGTTTTTTSTGGGSSSSASPGGGGAVSPGFLLALAVLLLAGRTRFRPVLP